MSGDGATPPGVQAERTTLAWHRTALSLAVGALAAGRVLEPVTGAWVWALAVTGALVAGALGWAGGRRSRAWALVLAGGHGSPAVRAPGAGLLAAAALGSLVLGGAAAALVLA
ncbi:DUF202 domain-containing protein [Cellulomonas hominis]|uniref:DUF202 domain-containing protein n=1 Tax=Cellulomonas hominis TaxID=156981 RepID=UPI0032E0179B